MRSRKLLATAFTLLLLTLSLGGPTGALAEMEEETSLTGRLAENQSGQFVLVEPESGDQIRLRGAEDALAELVGASVTVTGHWAKDEEGTSYFAVSKVKASEA